MARNKKRSGVKLGGRGSKGQRGKHGFSQKPTHLRGAILDVFRRSPDKPLNHKQVASAMGILNHEVRRLIMELMSDMASKEKLIDLGRGKYKLAVGEVAMQEGTIQITKFGRGFVMLEDGNEIKIPNGFTGKA
jgi:exoribonuclease R